MDSAPQPLPDAYAALRPREAGATNFDHVDHVRLAWTMIRRYGCNAAEEVLCTLLPLSLRNAGAPADKFHETLTRAWTRVVAAADAQMAPGSSFDDLMASHPELTDRRQLSRYYSDEVLFSAVARSGFVEPDLAPLPPPPPIAKEEQRPDVSSGR